MVLVRPSVVEGKLSPPPSKSYSHRALSVALLSDRKSQLYNVSLARDVRATLNAVRAMGAVLSLDETEGGANIEVEPPELPITPEDVIDCSGSGTTIRFFAAISSLTDGGYTILTGNEGLRRRPMGPLIEAINSLGGWATSSRLNGLPPLIVRGGGLRGGEATLPGHLSSQFFSALLIAGSMSELGVKLIYNGPLVSRPYLEMTAFTLRKAGSKVSLNEVLGVDPVRPRGIDFTIPGDFGLAAPLMVMASLTGGRLNVSGLDRDIPQADSLIEFVLKAFGVKVAWENGSLLVEGRPVRPAKLDLRNAPDLFPLAAVLAAFVKGRSVIRGIAHARVKESDRISNMRTELEKVGVRVIELEDGLVVEGSQEIRGSVTLDAHGDHRIFMALTALAAASKEPCEVRGEEWVADSYPNFLRDAIRLGLVIN